MVGFSIFELSQMDLSELLEVAKADPSNNSKAMKELVRRFQKDADYIASRVCFAVNDRVDVMNAALMGIVNAVRAHDGRGVGFKSYLKTTMTGEARRMSQFLSKQVLISEGDAYDEAIVRDSKHLPSIIDDYDPAPYGSLTLVIEQLSDDQQVIVDEMFRQELTHSEIASRHNVTPSAISQRVKVIYRNLAATRAA